MCRPDVPGALAQLTEPLDYQAGLLLALEWYPWMLARKVDHARRKRNSERRRRAANSDALRAGLGGYAFPFGAQAPWI
jgi:hypothetical protein